MMTVGREAGAVTLAILGANGRLGSAVAREAAHRGHHVVAVTRDGRAGAHLPPGVEARPADATDAAALTAVVAGADVVVNGLNPPYPAWHRTALPMLEAVLAACEATGAHHLFPGNVYAFGAAMPALLCADAPERPTTRKGAVRQRMEAALRDAAAQGRVRTTVLRAGDFFGGPVRGAWFDLVLAAKLDRGIFTYPGPLDVPHAWAYLPELAGAFIDLAERAPALPRFAALGFAGHTMTGAEMRDAVSRASDRTLRTRHLPWPLLRAAGLVHPMSREVAEMAYLWRVTHRIDGADHDALTDMRPETDRDDAVGHALRDLGL